MFIVQATGSINRHTHNQRGKIIIDDDDGLSSSLFTLKVGQTSFGSKKLVCVGKLSWNEPQCLEEGSSEKGLRVISSTVISSKSSLSTQLKTKRNHYT